ncbi:hypothetical protein [Pseudonocardia xishanensis]|uniref:N,N-dimethylformamidase alpha subunit domain-containing protein n=1 Tax=Pseudonocardia xishanensis TaxID=630995 RepID=A0ABP8RW67_9PSEU
MPKFQKTRVEALRPLVTPDLVAAHRDNPRGPHSHELNLVLNFVRGPAFSMDRKPFALVLHPYDEYGLAFMTARGESVEVGPGSVYSSEPEAIHAVFLQRLEAHGLWSDSEGRSQNV